MDINIDQNINLSSSENLARANDLKLRESARKLESVFLKFMLKPMEEGMTKSTFGEEDSNTNLAKTMFSQVMADAMSKNSDIGLSETIYKHLKKLEEKQGAHLQELELQSKNFLKIDRE